MQSTLPGTTFGTFIFLMLLYTGFRVSLAEQNSAEGNEPFPRVGENWKVSDFNLMPRMTKLLERDVTCQKGYILCSGISNYDVLLNLCRFTPLLLS